MYGKRTQLIREHRAFRRVRLASVAWACGMLVTCSAVLAQRPLGIDVSKWQGDVTLDEWRQVYNSGRVFAFIKASQGTIVTDEKFANNIVNARAAGLLVSPYHFADPLNQRQPNEPAHTAVDEANWFVSVAGNYMTPGYLPPVLDLEYGASMGVNEISAWANQFCNRVLQLKGVRPMIYTSTNWAANYVNSSVNVWDLWIANWGYTNPQTQSPPTGVWPTWVFWQYSSTGSVPGIDTDVDLDVFNGTMAQLQAYLIGEPGHIILSTNTLSQTIRAGLTPPSQNITVAIGGGTSLYYNLTVGSSTSWLSVNPAMGFSAGEADPITVSYLSMPIGTYTTSITVNATGATNNPQVIPVTLTVEPVPGDLDADGDIDVQDVVRFNACMTAPLAVPGGTLSAQCTPVDYDHDGDVDQTDFGTLQKCISGPATSPNPSCPES